MDLDEFQDPNFRVYRKYDKLVRRNLAKPIACKICRLPFTTMLDADDMLILKCFGCGSMVRPGAKDIDAVKKIVEEHFGR